MSAAGEDSDAAVVFCHGVGGLSMVVESRAEEEAHGRD